MARVTTDELHNYRMDVTEGERQVVDNGMPVINGTGEPKTETIWLLVYSMAQPDGTVHVVKAPALTDEQRRKLVQALSGGIHVATHLPPGIELSRNQRQQRGYNLQRWKGPNGSTSAGARSCSAPVRARAAGLRGQGTHRAPRAVARRRSPAGHRGQRSPRATAATAAWMAGARTAAGADSFYAGGR